jgi:hypothetical protein
MGTNIPPTSAMLRGRMERKNAPLEPSAPTGAPDPVPTPTKSRLEDQEIRRFDRVKVRKKFCPPR